MFCVLGQELKPQPSSDYSDESESESENPKSTSPKGFPTSKSPSQKSGASSSAASSHGSSKEGIDHLKETEQELLDEIIVKDVPNVSTDPVLQFEDKNNSCIQSIHEDAEDQHSECKDLFYDIVTSCTNPSLTSLPPHSLSNPNEMPFKEEDHCSNAGLAAPDSKDSLEVHLYSVSDDISETLSVKDETEKARNYSTQSEDDSAVDVEPAVAEGKVFEERSAQEDRRETKSEDETSSGEEQFEVIYSEELKDEKLALGEDIETIGEIYDEKDEVVNADTKIDNADIKYAGYTEVGKQIVEEVKKEVYTEVQAEQIVASIQNEALAEVLAETETESRKITEVMKAFEKLETDEKSDVNQENAFKSTMKKLEECISSEEECVAVTAYKTTRSMSSSSEEASKLVGQDSLDSNSATGPRLVAQDSSDSSASASKTSNEHSSLKQAVKKLEEHVSSEEECVAVTAYKTTRSMSSSSEEASKLVGQDSLDSMKSEKMSGIVAQDSTDTSESTKQEVTENTVKIHEEVEQIGSIEDDASEAFKHSSSDSSDTEEKEEHKGAESSSDYDTSSAKPRAKRPDSFVSDTSSDYDSMSNPGSRRPQSFLVEDEYDIITEEETADTKSRQEDSKEHSEEEDSLEKKHRDESFDELHEDSSSASEGPDEKKQEKIVKEETSLSLEQDGISFIPRPSSSSPLPSSVTNTLDLHANQSTVSVDLAVSSVIHSNTLEEIDPLVVDGSRAPSTSSPLADGFLPPFTPSPLTRSSDFNTEDKSSYQGIRKSAFY